MDPKDIYQASLRFPDFYADIVGIGRRIAPELSDLGLAKVVCTWIAQEKQLWHQSSHASTSPSHSLESVANDSGNGQASYRNPVEYLLAFKEFERSIAKTMHRTSAHEDWSAMQEKLALYITESNFAR